MIQKMRAWRWPLMAFLIINALFVARVPLEPRLWMVSTLAILLFAAPIIYGAWQWLGYGRGSWLLLVLGLYALVFETIAIYIGWPYGNFDYTEVLGPKLFGAAPATVLLAWTPLILGVLAFTKTIKPLWHQAVLATLLLVTVDLVLDPAAVHVGFWRWQTPGLYYGVPIINFVGWILSGGIAITGMLIAIKKLKWPAVPDIFGAALGFILVFWTAVNAWAGLYVPAMLGLILSVCFYRKFLVSPRP